MPNEMASGAIQHIEGKQTQQEKLLKRQRKLVALTRNAPVSMIKDAIIF